MRLQPPADPVYPPLNPVQLSTLGNLLNIHRRSIVADRARVENTVVANYSERLISWTDEAAGHTSHEVVAIFNATDGKIWRHAVDRDALIGELAGSKRSYPPRRAKEGSQPAQDIACMNVGASRFKFILG